ncbi:hypothetical protein JCM10207_000529 [Rhodosporidiobolus poonsookiae]
MDDLLDLDFAAPSKSQPAKQSAQAAYGSRTAFDYLAQQNYRTPSPAAPPIQPARTPTPQNARPQPTASPAGGDAFAGLFGTSPAPAATANGAAMSMQDRLHHDSARKIGGYGALGSAGGNAFGGLSPAASGTGSRAGSPALQPPLRVASPASSVLTPTSRALSPAAPAPAPAAKPSDPWDFDLLNSSVPAPGASKPAARPAAASPAPADDPFDMGFDSLPSSSSAASKPSPTSAPAADDFDLLDAFSAPARASPSPAPAPAPAPAASSAQRAASPPPHILGHLVEMGFSPSAARAALVATAGRDGTWQLEAAVDALMGSGSSSSSAPSAPAAAAQDHAETPAERRRREKQQREQDEWGDDDDVRIGRRRSWEFEDDAAAERAEREAIERRRRAAQAQARQAAQGGEGDAPRPAGRRRDEASGASNREQANDPTRQLQEQANEVLAQAQKIGFSMFKTANSFWGQGKEALAKVVEEQRAAARAAAGLPGAAQGAGAAGGAGAAEKGRPKWWREGMDDEDGTGSTPSASKGKGRAADEQPPPSSFKDSDDEGADPVLAPRPRQPPPRQQQQPPAAAPSAASEYRSPFRRAKAAPAPSPAPVEGDLLSGASAPPPARSSSSPAPSAAASRLPPARSPAPRSPAPRPTRPHVDVSSSAVASALKHKEKGNDDFKLGRFGDAAASYTSALDALPTQWLGRVPLLNNRAQARLRSGEEKAAAEDCSEALAILILPPASLAALDLSALDAESAALSAEVLSVAGGALDLKEHLGKALGRRAKALEATEKWRAAGDDWDALLRIGDEAVVRGAGGRKVVNEGAARCRKMLGGGSSSSTPSSPAPRPTPPAAAAKPAPRPRASPSPAVQPSGAAVAALKASNAAAAAEDDLRHALKDSVDARIGAWKGGKEANLRALIASLDTVLWPELGWKTVGMHELIAENQLKVKYVRAIAKVHPDKLNVGNTTVEQRMIAGLVFAALNDAWNSSK